ncbi:hypothetical protein BKN38_01415 [Helicobacter sp. CLO-3]|uniref:DUF6115 domain-containing protein n=1 Tax=unclassified Helicobacter TaxID=2593540 RepID=UPI000805C588|nr:MULTISPECIES: hypothetical protein [unclassified Helicobacter]OBV29768.1 hypothetical protein BA723_00220 [Helicobacter sp. CLO-3]OHU85221.1 hypothetical protein BKN38_01415 [Helicobacter sp. CLO-3]
MIDEELFIVCMGGMGFVIVCILAYIIIKDKDTYKRVSRFETAIEAITKEIYKIQKTQQQIQTDQASIGFMGDKDGAKYDANNDKIQALNKKVIELDKDIDLLKNHYDEKIISLENRMREYGHFSSTGGDVDEKKIIDMFQNGFSIDSIAKELRIGRGEVEFTLKLANIK